MKIEVGRRRERKLKVAGKDGWPEKMKMKVVGRKYPWVWSCATHMTKSR